MSSSVERIKAADDIALFDILSVSQASETSVRVEFREQLRERLGTISRMERPRSSQGDILALLQPIED